MKLPPFESLDKTTIDLMMLDMPPAFLPIIEVIGLKAAMKLQAGFTGQVFIMPKNITLAGKCRFKAISEVIGVDAAFQLRKHFGGEKLTIPILAVVARKLRNRSLIRDFDAMLKTTSSANTVNALATRYGITSRQVECISGGKGGGTADFHRRVSFDKGYTPKLKPAAVYGSKR